MDILIVADPVLQQDDEWFFLDETGLAWGPYTSEAIARAQLTRYCIWLDTGCVENSLVFPIPD